MQSILMVILVVSSIALIGSVLMHSGKSAGLSGSIAGGAEQLFGKEKAKGYDKMFENITKYSAILFLASSLLVTVLQ